MSNYMIFMCTLPERVDGLDLLDDDEVVRGAVGVAGEAGGHGRAAEVGLDRVLVRAHADAGIPLQLHGVDAPAESVAG